METLYSHLATQAEKTSNHFEINTVDPFLFIVYFSLMVGECPRAIDPKVLLLCRRTHFKLLRFELSVKSLNVRITFNDTKPLQNAFNIVAEHNLIFLVKIWHELSMMFQVKGDECT